jgi:hypothetical protein
MKQLLQQIRKAIESRTYQALFVQQQKSNLWKIEPATRSCRKKEEYINLHCEEMPRIRRPFLVVLFIRLPSARWSDADPALNPRATPRSPTAVASYR